MTNYSLPNNFWMEISSGPCGYYYRSLIEDPDLNKRVLDALKRYGYRLVLVGEATAKNDLFYRDSGWHTPGISCLVTSHDFLIVRQIAKASVQL